MKSMSFEESKKVELDILESVASFCEENGIRYFLAYGTLIGALRHKGFIPWDDDIDIQMPREDYNRLISSFNEKKHNPNLCLVPPHDPKSRHPIVKIIDVRTVKIEEGVDYSAGSLGVDIDIFPIDGQPDNEVDYQQWYKKLRRLYAFYTYSIMSSRGGSLKKRLLFSLIKMCMSRRYVKKRADSLHKKYPYESSKYLGTIESAFNSIGNRVERECFSDFVLVEFEGKQFRAPIGYDAILTKIYGDYMQLPPEEKRVSHHSANTYWKENESEKV